MKLLLDTHVFIWMMIDVATFPLHHTDPFDRLIAAQAHIESMSLVTADAKLAPYGVPIIW